MTLREIRALSRLSASFLGQPWYAQDDEIWQGGERLGRMQSKRLAQYLSELHNQALPLANTVVLLVKQLTDVRKMKNEQRGY